MLIKITVQGGVVHEIETIEPAVNMDVKEVSTFETVAQDVALKADPAEPQLTDPSAPRL